MTKNNSSRNYKSSRSSNGPQSKMNRLHRKLCLKQKNEANIDENRETDENAQPGVIADVKHKKLYQRASPMKLVKLYPLMSEDQFELIRKADFGGLTIIGFSQLYPEVCKYVMQCFDPDKCELVFPGRGSIPVSEESVYEVLGVPWGDEDVIYKMDRDASKFMLKQMGHKSKIQPTLKFLEKKIIDRKKADWTYLRLWTTYAMCSVVAPTTGTQVSPRIYPSLCNIKEVNRLNVCKFVIKMLRKAAKSGVEQGVLKACMLYFMVKYLDSLELEGIEINQEGTRVGVWTNKLVKQAIIQDTFSDGTFGKAPLKAEFATRDSESVKTDSEEGGATSEEQSGKEKNDTDTVVSTGTPTEQDISVGQSSSQIPAGQNDGGNFAHDEHFGKDQDGDHKEVHDQQHDGDRGHGFSTDQDASNSTEDFLTHGVSSSEHTPFQSVLFSEPTNISDFVKLHTPATATEEETKYYTDVVKEYCYGFEKGLHSILNKLLFKPIKNRKQRTAVSKVRRSRTDGSQSKHPGIPTVETTEPSSVKECKFDAVHSTHVGGDSNSFNNLGHMNTSEAQINRAAPEHDKAEINIVAVDMNQQTDGPSEQNIESKSVETIQDSVAVEDQKDVLNNGRDCGFVCGLVSEAVNPVRGPSKDQIQKAIAEETVQPVPGSSKEQIQKATIEDTVHPASGPSMIHNEKSTVNPEKNEPGPMKQTTKTKASDQMFEFETDYDSTSENSQQDVDHYVPDSDIFNIKRKQKSKFNFLDFVKGTTVKKPEQDMFHFESPVMLDLDYCRPSRQELHDCLKSIKELKISNEEGLPSMLDGIQRPEVKQILMDMEPKKIRCKKMKVVTFADQSNLDQSGKEVAATPSKYRTRSTSRVETELTKNKGISIPESTPAKAPPMSVSPRKRKLPEASPSPRPSQILTRSKQAMLATPDTPKVGVRDADHQVEGQLQEKQCLEAADSMVRRLNFSSSDDEKRKLNLGAAPDAPSFDLGFDTQDTNIDANSNKPSELADTMTPKPGCSKDKSGEEDASKTPVPHEYQKRILKAPKCLQPPYTDYENKKVYTVSKAVDELYKMVCMHGSKTGSKSNDDVVFDNGDLFVHLGTWADSVKPGKKLVNIVCEVAIHIIQAENTNSKKVIMPLRISKYLIDCRLNSRDVLKAFCPTDTYRLDHKELICFPTLQSFGGVKDNSSGHYWLVTLNIKAERFELMDSMTNNKDGEPIMMEACHLLVASIKTLWAKEYASSHVDISNFPMVPIPCPRQTTGFDCGFFMLKLLETWHGRRMFSFDQSNMESFRKLFNDKWLRWHENKAEWKIVI